MPVYRGPILLAFDHRYNLGLAGEEKMVRDWDEWKPRLDYGLTVPELDAAHMDLRPVEWEDWLPPVLLLETEAVGGQVVRLCDYGSAGEGGTPYVSWLPVQNLPPRIAFSQHNPLRSVRA